MTSRPPRNLTRLNPRTRLENGRVRHPRSRRPRAPPQGRGELRDRPRRRRTRTTAEAPAGTNGA
ncbi:hypothetical protein E4U92_11075 [Streptomyces galbus]|uniref:Uncharacterized protein n=1 Tax=Streptomyces galbus TaxID=33898 RepID=A0A4U5X2G7_STRGB|nr:hypothetical protein E4U92_11075 [Streptomyces galbus]